MSLIFLVVKLYPVFGISLTFLLFDFSRNFYRKGNRAWIGALLFSLLFFASTIVWVVLRGDKNADLWFMHLSDWLRHG